MSKCTKVKNPCKICLDAVTQKNGLQCQGACQSWVHYSCLNYTPGKIKDIKAGIIKVTCPCPDCKTSMPKEYRTDQPYSCNNSMCPANRPPQCDNNLCPTNARGQATNLQPPPCPLNKCGNDCKQFSTPHLPESGCKPSSCPNQPPAPCGPAPDPFAGVTSSDACLSRTATRCVSGCASTNDVSGDYRFNQRDGGGGGMQSMPSYHVVEQMCNTVGELSNQLRALMTQMRQDDGRGGGGLPPLPSHQRQPTKSCPKPCYCPGNPARRM
ncbi:hypothetical protein PYW07_010173 [Mythimna separata]|uniref:PHD-type domain-containing protein n=1 Tax=Mythimna separata TaxID=271217 RepID=A0AAD7YGZ0_MYTSE|nr:hypothetical protein PYW07_010173 [Mythimna separata]